MDGGSKPIQNGDWVVFRWARNASGLEVEGRVALVAIGDPDVGETYHIKRLSKRDGRWWLVSDNESFPPVAAHAAMQVIALCVGVVP